MSAPPVVLRRRTMHLRESGRGGGGGARSGGGRAGDGGSDARQGDEDSTAAGCGAAGPSGRHGHSPAAPPALNTLVLPIQNPVFLAFAPCGTRLALMNAQRHGEEIALHVVDLTVSLVSLYGRGLHSSTSQLNLSRF